MAQVSVGQVENLEDLVCGLESVRESLEFTCREQIAAAYDKFVEANEEMQTSENMLSDALHAEQEAQRHLDSANAALNAAESSLSACEAQPDDEDGYPPDCSCEEAGVANAEAVVAEAEAALTKATENRCKMEQRVEYAGRALTMAENLHEQSQRECVSRLVSVCASVDTGKTRLTAALQALDAYLAADSSGRQFYSWLKWQPERGKPITPDIIRERINLSTEQQRLFQEYLYDRNPTYRNLIDRCRGEWAAANGDAERNIVNRKVRIHLSGSFAEQMAQYALAPLGDKIETQGRTFVGDSGRYTKTDLIITDLRAPVILGRGNGMGAPAGGSVAFEIKCGRADYLYKEKDHMIFQAEGHKEADAHCVLCSRDIHDRAPEKERKLRESLRDAGSPMIAMLPAKKDIDKSCLDLIRQDTEKGQT